MQAGLKGRMQCAMQCTLLGAILLADTRPYTMRWRGPILGEGVTCIVCTYGTQGREETRDAVVADTMSEF